MNEFNAVKEQAKITQRVSRESAMCIPSEGIPSGSESTLACTRAPSQHVAYHSRASANALST